MSSLESGKATWIVAGIITLIALTNALYHPVSIAYDLKGHLKNVASLSNGHLPSRLDSREFFSPPLPYVVPALAQRLLALHPEQAYRLGMLLNVGLLLASLLFIVRIYKRLCPVAKGHLIALPLIFIAICPVVYKSFAMVRGEPFLFFFACLSTWQAIRIVIDEAHDLKTLSTFGLSLGALALSRQWGVLLYPALIIFSLYGGKKRGLRKNILVYGAPALVAITTAAWFYQHLAVREASVTAFNREPAESVAVSNQPEEFYFGLGNGKLFSKPTSHAFPNQLLPILYSEFWGDYWKYFQFASIRKTDRQPIRGYTVHLYSKAERKRLLETNQKTTIPALRRSNFLGILPTLLFCIGIIWAVGSLRCFLPRHSSTYDQAIAIRTLLFLQILFTLGGYFWFLVTFPNPGKGDTIKATYILQAVPAMVLLSSAYLSQIIKQSKYAGNALYLTILVTWAMNYKMYFSGHLTLQ